MIYKTLTQMKDEASSDLTDKQKSLFAILTRNTMLHMFVSEENQIFEQQRVERELNENRELAIFTVENL